MNHLENIVALGVIGELIDEIDNESFRKSVEEKINKISNGTRDLRF